MKENRPKFQWWSLRCLTIGFVLASLTAVVLYATVPPQHRATATLLIRAEKQQFLFEVPQPSLYSVVVNTQITLLRSPPVIDKALENPVVAKLPIISKQRDKRGWLTKSLRIKREGRSEVVSVSIKTDSIEASEKIVNAVVDAYLRYAEDSDRKAVNNLIQELNAEKRRQQSNAQTLQESIRAGTKQVAGMDGAAGQEGMIAGFAQSESLQRHVDLARTQLIALKAKHTAIQELIIKPGLMPIEVFAHSRFAELNDKRTKLQQERDELLQMTNLDHPRVRTKDQEIAQVDEEIAKMTGSTDDSGANSILEQMRRQEQLNLYSVEREIRTQESYLTELENKYKEQLVNNADHSEGAANVAFLQAQLARVDKTLGMIDERILAVQSEARNPGQIVHLTAAVSSMPSVTCQIVAAGVGFLMVFFATLFLGIVTDCLRFLGFICRKGRNRNSQCPTEDCDATANPLH